jgi:hypothetical protein
MKNTSNDLCFKVTPGLISAWRLGQKGRSTEYTYLVLNNCTCGECINKYIIFDEEEDL